MPRRSRIVYEPVARHPSWFLLRWFSTVTGLLLAIPFAGALIVHQWWLGVGSTHPVLPIFLLTIATVISLHLRKLEREHPDLDAPGETAKLLFGVAWLILVAAVMSAFS